MQFYDKTQEKDVERWKQEIFFLPLWGLSAAVNSVTQLLRSHERLNYNLSSLGFLLAKEEVHERQDLFLKKSFSNVFANLFSLLFPSHLELLNQL